MWCAYAFAALALVSLPDAIRSNNVVTLVSWISQTFLQLVLLSIIIVGQNIQAAASDSRAEATYEDADAVLHTALAIQHHLEAQDAEIEGILAEVRELSGLPDHQIGDPHMSRSEPWKMVRRTPSADPQAPPTGTSPCPTSTRDAPVERVAQPRHLDPQSGSRDEALLDSLAIADRLEDQSREPICLRPRDAATSADVGGRVRERCDGQGTSEITRVVPRRMAQPGTYD
jgi:hypothetical protein